MKLSDYIKKHHGGSQLEFAKSQGMTKQNVWRMLQKNCWYVYDDMLMMAKHNIKAPS